MRLLVVEDNEVVAQAITVGLRDQGIAVDAAVARGRWPLPASGKVPGIGGQY